jgi:diadenosine tetraphosphate (Ap4A) HIT family hydrolase
MPSVFSQIIAGELPARFVWQDDLSVAFLTIRPLRPGHTLVVPRLEVDHWIDLEPPLLRHVMDVSHQIGRALEHGFHPVKVGMIIAGLEVPHVHVHLVPFHTMTQLNFAQADPNPRPEDLDEAAATIRGSLAALGISPAGPATPAQQGAG